MEKLPPEVLILFFCDFALTLDIEHFKRNQVFLVLGACSNSVAVDDIVLQKNVVLSFGTNSGKDPLSDKRGAYLTQHS